MYLRLHLGRKAIWIILIVLALMAVYPVIFLSVGSLMGADELEDSLGAVVSGTEGYVSFPILPKYPTLQHFAEVLLDSPEFFVMFWNSILITFGVLGGQFVVGTMAAWGFARYDFPCRR